MKPLGKVIILQHAFRTLAVYQRMLFEEPCRDSLVFTKFCCAGPPTDDLITMVAQLSEGSHVAFMALSTGTNIWPGGYEEPRIKEGWEQMHAVVGHRVGLARVIVTPEKSALAHMVNSAREILKYNELA